MLTEEGRQKGVLWSNLPPAGTAVAILFPAWQLFHIAAVTCLPVTDTEVTWLRDMLTAYPALFCMFCMRFANLKKFHKALHRTHQIKGQYELLCLKWLESGLTTGQ